MPKGLDEMTEELTDEEKGEETARMLEDLIDSWDDNPDVDIRVNSGVVVADKNDLILQLSYIFMVAAER